MERIHFVGIGGIGVSALARYYRTQGFRVTGSDLVPSEITRDLVREGIVIRYGHARTNVPAGADRVVYSPAVREKNPELREARRRRIPVLTYPEAVGELTRQYETVAVSGSHGKSTTTALIGLMLTRAGLDPTVIVGTKLHEFRQGNFRSGKSRYLVLEADEWNRSFHAYHPKIAVLTNIDREHLDTYKTFSGVVAGFQKYVRNVPRDGTVVANWHDRAIRKIVRGISARVVWYNRKTFVRHPLWIPGSHNQVNAEAAWQTVRLLGVPKRTADAVFCSYRGAWRRLEKLRVISPKSKVSAVLYTDYAHHPTEIRATLQALRERHPDRRIVAVFQPHHADRLARLFKEFQTAFNGASQAIVLPVYRVAGREKGTPNRDAAALVRAIQKPSAQFARNAGQAFVMLEPMLKEKIVIVCMSAGDLDAAVRRFAAGKLRRKA